MFGTGEDRRQNEYRQLTSGVQRLIQSNYHMQDALRNQKERERRSVIDQLLKGQMTDEQEIREALDRVGVMPGQGKTRDSGMGDAGRSGHGEDTED